MIPFSKTMRMPDFQELEPELALVDKVLWMLNGGDKAQHPMRRWEYAMAVKAYTHWTGNKYGYMSEKKSIISDHGCCTGMLAPLMFYLGNDVRMYEVWSWGNQEALALQQMEMVKAHAVGGGSYQMIHRPLGHMIEEDKGVDVAFCISTMEHIPPYELAFRQMCQTVNPGGMLFMTTDSAEDEHDHYIANNVRAGTMFNATVYQRLAAWGEEEGFKLMNETSDWSWDEGCRMLPTPTSGLAGYGFACMAMERK
jgi:2-polyprenyl-3-methyl-5-hydroxy-6-metoxy-1,4-benzoquinol methylase